jgi:hypothetical protein
MGNVSSGDIPDTELTPVAKFVKGLGVKLVAFDFDGVMLMYKFTKSLNHHWTISVYNEAEKKNLTTFVKNYISIDAVKLILSLLGEGLSVAITTHQDGCDNGKVQILNGEASYIYEGSDLITNVLLDTLGKEVTDNIRIISISPSKSKLKDVHFNTLKKDYHLLSSEILVIDDNTEIINFARSKGYHAFFVQDHNDGFNLT